MTSKTKIALSAALGGVAPNLAVLAARLLGESIVEFPTLQRAAAYGFGLLIMAGMGAGVAALWGETSYRKAFYLGFGLPAMVQLNFANLDSMRKARVEFEKATAGVAAPASGQGQIDSPAEAPILAKLLQRAFLGHAALAQSKGVSTTAGTQEQVVPATEGTRQLFVEVTSPALATIDFLDRTGTRIETRRLASEVLPVPRDATAFELRVGDSRAGPFGLPRETFGDAGLKVRITERPAAGFLKALGAWSTDSWKLDASVVAYPRRMFPHALAADTRAKEVFQTLSSRLSAASIQLQPLRPVSEVPGHSEIRFYYENDRSLAEQAAAAAAAAGVPFTVVDHTTDSGASAVRPRTIEAWLAAGAAQAPSPKTVVVPKH